MHARSLVVVFFLTACATPTPAHRSGVPLHQRPENAHVSGTLTVEIAGIDGMRGQLYVELYDEAAYFDYEKVLNEQIVPVTGETMTVTLEHVPAGRYALAVSHDANSNDAMDTGLFGVPTERYGFSRDARGTFGPPAFVDAAFDFSGAATLRVTLR